MQGSILYGESPAELIAAYTAATGRMRPLPDWILEWRSGRPARRHTRSTQCGSAIKGTRHPVAAVWLQDWVGQRTTSFGKQLWWNWILDREHYPEWEANDRRPRR